MSEQVFNYVAGSLARVFTTVQEVNDPMMLYPTIAAFVLNLVIALQMVYYWNAPSKKTKAKGKQRETPIAAAVAQSSAVPNKARTPTTRRRG
jgi:mannose-P-dolichol utilization defect protein 1